MLSWWQSTFNFSSYSAAGNCSLKTEAGQVGWGTEQALAAPPAIGRTLCYQITRHPCSWLKNKNIVTIFHNTWHGQWAGNNILASCSLWRGILDANQNHNYRPGLMHAWYLSPLLSVIVMKCLKKYFYLLLWSSTITIANNKKLYFCLFAVANQVQQDFGVLMQHHITLITISLNC